MRLGAWGRLWVVATGIWMLGGTLYLAIDQNRISDGIATSVYRSCITVNARYGQSTDECQADFDAYHKRRDNMGSLRDSAILAGLIWIPVSALAFALYWSIRWILAGRGNT